MGKGKRIPNDWDEQIDGYVSYMLCCPNSPDWKAYVTGAIYELTRGRGWDEDTGSIIQTQNIAKEIFESMTNCNDLERAIRQLTAVVGGQQMDLTVPIPDTADYTNDIWGEQTLDELISAIQALQPGLIDTFGDLANIIIAAKAMWPGTTKVRVVMPFYERLMQKRYWHNHLTIQAYQASALNKVARGITSWDESIDPEQDEKDLLNELGSTPWLARAAVIFSLESVTEKIWLIGDALGETIFGKAINVIKVGYNLWWSKWINKVEDRIPPDNVTGAIGVLTDAVANTSTPGQVNVGGISDALLSIRDSINDAVLNCLVCKGTGCDSCSGGAGGTITPPESGTEGETPPENYVDIDDLPGTPPYQDRKCKVSEMLYNGVLSFVQKMAQLDVDTMFSVLGSGFVITAIGIIVAGLTGPIAIGLTVIGAITGIALRVIGFQVDFDGLVTIIENNKDDLICALYNASSGQEAGDDFLAVLTSGGANTAQTGVIGAVLTYASLNSLFFSVANGTATFEEDISGFEGTFNCGSCGCLQTTYAFVSGNENWVGDMTFDASNGIGGTGCLFGEINTPNGSPVYLKNTISLQQVMDDIGVPIGFVDYDGQVEIRLSYKPSIGGEIGGGAYVEYEGGGSQFVDLWDGPGGDGTYHGPHTAVINLKKNGQNATALSIGIGSGGTNNQDRQGYIDNVTVSINC